MNEQIISPEMLKELLGDVKKNILTCECHYEKYLAWEKLHDEHPVTMNLKGTITNPHNQTRVTATMHPGNYDYWAADAPMALDYYPYNGSHIYECNNCKRLFFVYVEFGGHAPEKRCRLIREELLMSDASELSINNFDDIKDEISERIAAGESTEAVLMAMKERGISSLDFLPELVKEDKEKYADVIEKRNKKWKKTASIIFFMCVIGWIILWLIRHT